MSERGILRRAADWYEGCARPELVLWGVVIGLYGWTLAGPFVIDDFRHLKLMEAYRVGERGELGLYRFLESDEGNAAARAAGWYPWWLGDDVRFRHLRPTSEWALYGQYACFGARAWAFRLVSIGLYGLGVMMVLALLRRIAGDERVARWGALAFTVAAGHATPVVFMANQCDLIALVLVLGGLLRVDCFVRRGGLGAIAAATALYVIALGAKEASFPAMMLPGLWWWMAGRDEVESVAAGRRGAGRAEEPRNAHGVIRAMRRRALIALGVWMVVGLAWFAYYSRGGYGADTAIMLDPVRASAAYLAELPGRAVLLLSTWVVPVSPFLFYLRPAGEPFRWAFGVLGLIGLAWAAIALWRITGGAGGKKEPEGAMGRPVSSRTVMTMAAWPLVFLPVLACTVPDDRTMILPSVGLALFAGILMARRRRNIAILVFIVAQAGGAIGAAGVLTAMGADAERAMRSAAAGFGRPLRGGDCVFFVNDTRDSRVLFGQLVFESVSGREDVLASFLCDVPRVKASRLDTRRILLEAVDGGEALFESFLGRMARSRDRGKREGDEFASGELTGRIARVREGRVMAVEIEFREELESERYRFFRSRDSGPPVRWMVIGVGKSEVVSED